MLQVLIGKKIDQTQKFLNDGTRIPVTEIDVPDNAVLQVKTPEKDKYSALQIGFGKKKNPTKAMIGHSKKAGFDTVSSLITEVKVTYVENENTLKAGDLVKVEQVFKPGDIVDVTGMSKGKGFAGVVKRHHFRGGPKTHGQSDRLRAPGSIGQTTTPGRVYKGKKMAGRTGHEIVTIKNLIVVAVDEVGKKLFISGLIPGVKKSIVQIARVGEVKNFIPLFKIQENKESVINKPDMPQEVTEEKLSEKPSPQVEVEAAKIEEVKPEKKELKENKKGEVKNQK